VQDELSTARNLVRGRRLLPPKLTSPALGSARRVISTYVPQLGTPKGSKGKNPSCGSALCSLAFSLRRRVMENHVYLQFQEWTSLDRYRGTYLLTSTPHGPNLRLGCIRCRLRVNTCRPVVGRDVVTGRALVVRVATRAVTVVLGAKREHHEDGSLSRQHDRRPARCAQPCLVGDGDAPRHDRRLGPSDLLRGLPR